MHFEFMFEFDLPVFCYPVCFKLKKISKLFA
jgi:hypothetical protein